MYFPNTRLTRLRKSEKLRQLISENHLKPQDFIMPIFVHEGLSEKQPISSLPGMFQWSLSDVLEEVKDIVDSGISAIMLFGIPTHKDPLGCASFDDEGIVQKAIRLIKSVYPDLIVMADCCLCEYTSHGHCWVMPEGDFDADATLETLGKIAVSYAEAGVDVVAPSGMIDGMIMEIRNALDVGGYEQVSIMSYAAKYASGLYGPFREAAGSGEGFVGDRKHHQMSPAQRKEALMEARQDDEEGADFLMVKPGTFYLDILRDIADETLRPLCIYHVSGEYAMLKLAIDNGIVDEAVILNELFLSFKRAGATLIISYFAKSFVRSLDD